jgi:hypothetical protein
MKKLLMILALLTVVTPAMAVDGLNKVLIDEQGAPAPDVQAKDPQGACSFDEPQPDRITKAVHVKCMRLRDAIFHALVANFPDETALSGEDKYKRGVLAHRVFETKSDSLPLVASEIETIRKVVGKYYTAWYVFQVYEAVDPPK